MQPSRIPFEEGLAQEVIDLYREVADQKEPFALPLVKILKQDPELAARIQDVLAAQRPKWEQRREVGLYLKIVEGRLVGLEKKVFHQLLQKIDRAVQKEREDREPVWAGAVQAIQHYIRSQTKSAIAASSHLATHTLHKISEDNFAHIHAENYLSNTGLEGNMSTVMLKELMHYLKEMPNPSLEQQKLLRSLDKTLKLAELMESALLQKGIRRDKKEQFNQLASLYISSLQPGKSLLIPTGWRGKPTGHTMYFEVTREASGTFQVVYYNSGSGLNNHPGLVEGGRTLKQPFLIKEGVSEQFLINEALLGATFELNTVIAKTDGMPTEYGNREVYALFNALDGHFVSASDRFTHYIFPAGVGVCTWGALLAILLKKLPHEEYGQLNYHFRLRSLCDFYLTHKDQIVKDEGKELLLEKAMEQFARDALTAHREGIISLEELEKTHQTLKEMALHLEHAGRTHRFLTDNQRVLDMQGIERLPLREGKVIDFPPPIPEAKTQPTELPKVLNAPPFNRFDGLMQPSQVLQTLREFRLWCEAMDQSLPNASLIISLEKFYEQLPLPNTEKDFWAQIPPEDLADCASEIASLGMLAHKIAQTSNQEIKNNFQLGAIKGFAIVLDLAFKTPNGSWYRQGASPLELLVSQTTYSAEWGRPSANKNSTQAVLRKDLHEIITFLKSVQPTTPEIPLFSFMRNPFGLFLIDLAIGEYRGQKSQEQTYLESLADKPEIVEKLLQIDPNLAQATKSERVAFLFQDYDGKVIDPVFAALRKQALVAMALAHEAGDLKAQVSQSNGGRTVSIVLGENEYKRWGSNQERHQILKVGEPGHPINLLLTLARGLKGNRWGEARSKFLAKEAMDITVHKDQMPIYLMEDLLRMTAAGDRDGTDPHLELQPIKVLAFFTQNPELLQKGEWQEIFKLLFFEGDLLETLLKGNPTFLSAMEQFIEKQVQLFADRGDMKTQAFLFTQANRMAAIAKAHGLASRFPDPIGPLQQLLERPGLKKEETAYIATQLLTAYAEHPPVPFTEKEAIQLLNAGFAWGLHYQYQLDIDNDWFALAKAMAANREQLQAQLKGPAQQAILTSLCRLNGIQQIPTQWDVSLFPRCRSPEGIELNFDDFVIKQQGGSVQALPYLITINPLFREMFKTEDFRVREMPGNIYELIDERGKKFHLTLRGEKLFIQAEISEGRFATLLNEVPPPLKEGVGGISQGEGQRLWHEEDPHGNIRFYWTDKEQEIVGRIETKLQSRRGKILEALLDKEFQNDINHFWTSEANPDVRTIVQFLILETASYNIPRMAIKAKILQKRLQDNLPTRDFPLIEGFLKTPQSHPFLEKTRTILNDLEAPDQIVIERVEKFLPDGTVLRLAEPGEQFAVLKQFTENNQALSLWKNAQGEPVLLEFPTYHLSFKLEKAGREWRAASQDYPGYILSPSQKIKGLEGFEGGMVIENSKGERRAIIPNAPVKALKTGTLTRSFAFASAPHNRVLTYSIDPKQGITAKTKEEQIRLANLYLAMKEYKQAAVLLQKTYSKAIPYTQEEIELLKQFVLTADILKDGDPKAKNLSLLGFALILRDHPNSFNQADSSFWQHIESCIKETADPSKLGDILLAGGDEILVLKRCVHLGAVKEMVLDRLESLQGIESTKALRLLTPKPAQAKERHALPDIYNDSFRQWVADLRKPAVDQNPLITRPGAQFLYSLIQGKGYQQIKDHTPEGHIRLKLAQEDGAADRHLVDLMQAVWDNPASFPDQSTFDNVFGKGNAKEYNSKFLEPYNRLKPPEISAEREIPQIKKEAALSSAKEVPPAITVTFAPPRTFRPLLTGRQAAAAFPPVPFVGLALSEKDVQELKQAVDFTSRSPFAAKKTKEFQDDIQAAWPKPPKTRPCIPPGAVAPLKTRLLVQKAEEKHLLRRETEDLLAKANRIPAGKAAELIFNLEKQGALRHPITFNDLALCLARGDVSALQKKNPHLTPAELQGLVHETLNLVERVKRVQKIERGVITLSELEKILANGDLNYKADVGYLTLSERLQDELMRPSAYSASEHPEYSLFEMVSGLQLYPGQVADLDLLLKGDDLVLQKIMGSGKSKVFLPILALKKADGRSLPVIVVTNAMYANTLRDIEEASGGIFGQSTHTMEFHRDSDCSFEALGRLKAKLEAIIARKEYLVVTDTTLHCLNDKCKEMTLEYLDQCAELLKNNPTAELPPPSKELEMMRQITSLHMKGILDEADVLLNGRHEVNFTSGKAKPIDKAHAGVVGELFEAIFTSPTLLNLILSKQKHVDEAIFTQEAYRTTIKPLIMQEFIQRECTKEEKTPFSQYLKGLSETERKLVLDYWNGGKAGDAFVAQIYDQKIQNLLYIIKDELNELLPHTLNQTINYRYGKSVDFRELLPVPYLGNDRPSLTSRFGNPYEVLNYATQVYLFEGVSQNTLRALVENLKERALVEIAKDPTLNGVNTEAYQDFLHLTGGDKSYNLMKMHNADFAKLEARFKTNKKAVFEFLERHVYPLVEIHPGKISSGHLDLVDYFDETIGFTGTPWNKDLYHGRLKTHIERGTDGKTAGILKKNSSQTIRAISKNTYTAILDEVLSQAGPYRTFQDTAALFNGIPNETIAEEILKRVPHLKGVRFYDDTNRMQVLEKMHGKILRVPVERSQTSAEDCFTYFSQLDTIGKDTRQIDHARGPTTLGKSLMSHTLFQGVWRLRKLDQQQLAELVYIPEVAQFIREELGLEAAAPLDYDTLLRFTFLNQIKELEAQLPQNLSQKISHHSNWGIWKTLRDPRTDLTKLGKAISTLQGVLRKSQEDRPYEQYGRLDQWMKTPDWVKERIGEELALVDRLKRESPVFGQLDREAFKQRMEKDIPVEILPPTLKTPVKGNREFTVEALREMEQERQLNVQRLKELENMNVTTPYQHTLPFDHWHWSTGSPKLSPTSRALYQRKEGEDFKKMNLDPNFDYPERDKSHGNPPVVAAKEVFNGLPDFENFADVFSFDMTYNFLPMSTNHMGVRSLRERGIPFGKEEITPDNFLVLQDKQTKEMRMILLSQADTGYFSSALAKEQEKKAEEKELLVVLGNLELGPLQADDLNAMHALAKSPEWLRFTVEAKFYRGDLYYSTKEQEVLRAWVGAVGREKMEQLFYQMILQHKPEARKAYPTSPIGRILAPAK